MASFLSQERPNYLKDTCLTVPRTNIPVLKLYQNQFKGDSRRLLSSFDIIIIFFKRQDKHCQNPYAQ